MQIEICYKLQNEKRQNNKINGIMVLVDIIFQYATFYQYFLFVLSSIVNFLHENILIGNSSNFFNFLIFPTSKTEFARKFASHFSFYILCFFAFQKLYLSLTSVYIFFCYFSIHHLLYILDRYFVYNIKI